MPARHFTFTVPAADAGLRLDQLLAKHVPGLSRRTARKVLLIGGVFVEQSRVKVASKLLKPGRRVDVHLGSALDTVIAAEKGDPPALDLVFEDEQVVVVDKPPRLPSAATRESDRHDLLHYLSLRPSSPRTHLVHRLDLETSGLLVVAKTAEAAQRLSELFRDHRVERVYHAVLTGDLSGVRSVDEALAGRPARTTFTPLARKPGVTLAEARLDTGRTHQIRLHAQHIGHPVLGDHRYGRPGGPQPPRLALHAQVLGFAHPTTGTPMRFERPWPADLQDWWQAIPEQAPGA